MAEQIIAAVERERPKDLRWFDGKADAHERLFEAKRQIYQQDEPRRATALHHLRMYDSRYAMSVSNSDLPVSTAPLKAEARLKYNVCKAVTETAVSRLGRNRPKAQFLPRGGDWTIHQQSRRLGKYVEGVFDEARVYDRGRQAFRDGCITGTGVLKFYPVRKKKGWGIGCERVFPWELLVDDLDGRYGTPRQIIHVYYVPRQTLFDKYSEMPEWKRRKGELKTILGEADEGELDAYGRDATVDTVEVLEAYRLPSAPGRDDGKHMISVSSGVLWQETWQEEWFPYAIFRWNPAVVGFWGSGVIQAISGTQVHINRLLQTLSKAYHLFANPWLAISRESKIIDQKISNRIGRIIKYSGAVAPQLIAHKPLNDQFLQVLQQLKADAFEISGVGELAAINRKPAELESGEALRQFNDVTDARHADPALNYEDMYMQAARIICGLSRRMSEAGMPPRAMAQFRRRWRSWSEPIEWKEVEIAEEEFALQVYPTSILPSTPAGRTATIQEWLRAGFVDKATAHYLLEIPDLDSYASPELIMYEAILDDIEQILDEGEPRIPEPQQDLLLTRKLATAAYLRARVRRAPEDRLTLMINYIDATDRHMANVEAAQAQAAGPPGLPGGPNPQIPNLATLQASGVPV